MAVDTVLVPGPAVAKGYDNLTVVPSGGDETYSFGHLRLLE